METSTKAPSTTLPSAYRTNIAWVVMLLVSLLPNILVAEVLGLATGWIFAAKLLFLGVITGLSFVWPAVRALRKYFLILPAIFVAEEIFARLAGLSFWQNSFNYAGVPFSVEMLGIQLQRLGVSLVMILVLLLMGLRRKDFFLTLGHLKAPITPVRWLGFPKPDAWTRFGGQFAVYISLGTLVFLILGGRPAPDSLVKVWPIFPMVLLIAVLNAFNEEMTYRAGLLACLEPVIGSRQAVFIAAVFFGIGHFYGVPYGILGVVMATFLGWMMGKAMVETRGFFWAWFIHFLQDVMIFTFMAMGSITPGG